MTLPDAIAMTPAIMSSPLALIGAFGALLGAIAYVDGARARGSRLVAISAVLLLLGPFVAA